MHFPFSPAEELDFSVEWDNLEAGETIATSTWTITPAGAWVLYDAGSDGTRKTWVWIKGGAVGDYELTNQIVTSQQRKYERTLNIRVAKR